MATFLFNVATTFLNERYKNAYGIILASGDNVVVVGSWNVDVEYLFRVAINVFQIGAFDEIVQFFDAT